MEKRTGDVADGRGGDSTPRLTPPPRSLFSGSPKARPGAVPSPRYGEKMHGVPDFEAEPARK